MVESDCNEEDFYDNVNSMNEAGEEWPLEPPNEQGPEQVSHVVRREVPKNGQLARAPQALKFFRISPSCNELHMD